MLEPVRPEHAERLRELRATPEVAHWWDPAPEGWPLEPDPDLHRFTILLDGEVVGYTCRSQRSVRRRFATRT